MSKFKPAANSQVADNIDLLEIMMADTKASDKIYQPTQFWKAYEDKFIPELKNIGLQDFRKRKDSVLASFNATDVLDPLVRFDINKLKYINNRLFRKIPGWPTLMSSLTKKIESALVKNNCVDWNCQTMLSYCYVEWLSKQSPNAKPLSELSMSDVGNPEDIFEINGKAYSIRFLSYYIRYVFASKFINFNSINSFVELGSGAGRQVEVIKKLHPDTCYYLFDIPPQIYVAEQYLKSVFPDDVISYKTNRDLKKLPKPQAGKIFIFGNWQFPLLENSKVDLFWNAESFQEMEPHVVENYIKIIKPVAKNILLKQAPHGQHVTQKNEHGVLAPTTHSDYIDYLDGFELIGDEPSQEPYGRPTETTYDMFFKVKN